jgi:hypothetical protein
MISISDEEPRQGLTEEEFQEAIEILFPGPERECQKKLKDITDVEELKELMKNPEKIEFLPSGFICPRCHRHEPKGKRVHKVSFSINFQYDIHNF